MKDVIRLIDSILDVYDNSRYAPADGITYCNFAAQDLCRAFGCSDLDNKNADDIFKFLESSPNWSDVPMQRVQDMANAGSLIFATLDSESLGQAHGHICVVRPGNTVYSGKWGLVPRVMNIGSSNFIARAKSGPLIGAPCGVNESFVPLPKFYVLRSSL